MRSLPRVTAADPPRSNARYSRHSSSSSRTARPSPTAKFVILSRNLVFRSFRTIDLAYRYLLPLRWTAIAGSSLSYLFPVRSARFEGMSTNANSGEIAFDIAKCWKRVRSVDDELISYGSTSSPVDCCSSSRLFRQPPSFLLPSPSPFVHLSLSAAWS